MPLKETGEQENSVNEESISELEPFNAWKRPDHWEPADIDDLPEPEFDKYPLPDPEDLTELPLTPDK